ncbi:MAG: hypothetical protein K2F57_07270 [Candidatus Gastranaerophilales bacterium]|nr:hypothetical protein [Candidatus Gastranaerophilales bacterium]
MNITKLNPIGYEAKTEQGNTYKKSNAYKTGALTTAVAFNVAPYCFPKSQIAKAFTTEYLIKDLAKTFKKTIPDKLKTPISVLAIALDLAFLYTMGASLDKSLNKKRAAAANEAAKAIDNK